MRQIRSSLQHNGSDRLGLRIQRTSDKGWPWSPLFDIEYGKPLCDTQPCFSACRCPFAVFSLPFDISFLCLSPNPFPFAVLSVSFLCLSIFLLRECNQVLEPGGCTALHRHSNRNVLDPPGLGATVSFFSLAFHGTSNLPSPPNPLLLSSSRPSSPCVANAADCVVVAAFRSLTKRAPARQRPAHEVHRRERRGVGAALRVRGGGDCDLPAQVQVAGRRRGCHCAGIPSPFSLKRLAKGEEGAAE